MNETLMKQDKYGVKHYWLGEQRHREEGPAVEFADGTSFWYKYGQKHRENGPAVINSSRKEERWYKNDKLHRENGPAVIRQDLSLCKTHKHDNPPKEEWWFEGERHRDDGPAVIWFDGRKQYWENGKHI